MNSTSKYTHSHTLRLLNIRVGLPSAAVTTRPDHRRRRLISTSIHEAWGMMVDVDATNRRRVDAYVNGWGHKEGLVTNQSN